VLGNSLAYWNLGLAGETLYEINKRIAKTTAQKDDFSYLFRIFAL